MLGSAVHYFLAPLCKDISRSVAQFRRVSHSSTECLYVVPADRELKKMASLNPTIRVN